MPVRTPRLLGAMLALLFAGGLATARADSVPPAATAPESTTATTTATPATTTTPPPPPATVTTPPPAVTTATTPDPPPAATGHVTVTTAVPRGEAHHRHLHVIRARAAGASSVTIRDFTFGPSAITVHAGDTVTWVNDGPTDHTATGSGFDTGTLAKGQSGSHTFTSAGTFSYHCSLHPFMKGTVTVIASSTAAGSATGSTTATTPSAVTTTTTPAATGATLPRTGGDPPLLALAGLIVLLTGLALRRRMRR